MKSVLQLGSLRAFKEEIKMDQLLFFSFHKSMYKNDMIMTGEISNVSSCMFSADGSIGPGSSQYENATSC